MNKNFGFNQRELEYFGRDPLKKMNRRAGINYLVRVVGATLLVLLLSLYVITHMMPVLAAGPSTEPVVMVAGQEGQFTTLCAQYRSDHLMTGDKMDAETKELCGL